MKFLVDAHLPKRLALQLRAAGHDAIHTLDLPLRNRTPDAVINEISLAEERVVVTNDPGVCAPLLLRHPSAR